MKKPPEGGKLTRRGAWYDERASKSVKQVVPPQGGDRMSTEETIALLMLVIAAIKLGTDLKK